MRPPPLAPAAVLITLALLLLPSTSAWAPRSGGAADAAAARGSSKHSARTLQAQLLADAAEDASGTPPAGARTAPTPSSSGSSSSTTQELAAAVPSVVDSGVSVRFTHSAQLAASNGPVELLEVDTTPPAGEQPGSTSTSNARQQPAHLQASNSTAGAAADDKAAAPSSSSDGSNDNNSPSSNNSPNSTSSEQSPSPPPPPPAPSPAELAAATARTPTRRGKQQPAPAPSQQLAQPKADSLYTAGLGGFWYVPLDAGSDVPLGFPVRQPPGPPPSRWVMTAWQVSNFSSPALMSEDVMKEVQRMINNFTSMAPGQVQLAATASVTLGFGVGELPLAAAADRDMLRSVVTAAAASWAGDYDPAFISVSFDAPDYGVPAWQFQGASSQAVVTKDLTARTRPTNSSASSGGTRRLQQQQLTTASSHRQHQQQPAGRRLLQKAPREPRTGVNVWVSYLRLAPVNASDLIARVAASCEVDALAPGEDVSGSGCEDRLSELLKGAGVSLRYYGASLNVTDTPMTSLAIRLAIGVTDAQVSVGTDRTLASWLSSPRNIRNAIAISGVPDPIGPNASIKWLVTPEIWVAPPPPPPAPSNPLSKPANAVGVALGCAAFVMLVGVVAGLLLVRRHRRKQQEGDDKLPSSDTASSASSRRRRRSKRRYLAPAPPTPDTAAAAGSSAAAVAAGAAGVAAGSSSTATAADDDTLLSPDQIRPHLKELGDSVTSAVRFEADEEEGGDDEEGGSGGSGGMAAPAAGAGEAQMTPAQRVRAARAAIVAEHQQAGAAGAGAAAVAAAGGVAAAQRLPSPFASPAAAAGVTAAPTSGARAAGGRLPSPFAASSAQAHIQTQQEQQEQQAAAGGEASPDVFELQAARAQYEASLASAAAPAQQQQQHAVGPTGARRRGAPSPFALAYDFGALGSGPQAGVSGGVGRLQEWGSSCGGSGAAGGGAAGSPPHSS